MNQLIFQGLVDFAQQNLKKHNFRVDFAYLFARQNNSKPVFQVYLVCIKGRTRKISAAGEHFGYFTQKSSQTLDIFGNNDKMFQAISKSGLAFVKKFD